MPAEQTEGSPPNRGGRRIYVNLTPTEKIQPYRPNQVRTSKYSIISFLPKNLFEQFHGLANFYFLGIIILQGLPQFQQVDISIPTIPLAVILVVTAIKDGVEDLRRHRADDSVNKSLTYSLENWVNVNRTEVDNESVFSSMLSDMGDWYIEWRDWFLAILKMPKADNLKRLPHLDPSSYIVKSSALERELSVKNGSTQGGVENQVPGSLNFSTSRPSKSSRSSKTSKIKNSNFWKADQWKNLHVGDFILLRNNDRIPADVVVIATGEADGLCYIETKNLDGETNLKIKRGIKELNYIKTPEDCKNLKCYIDAEQPNANLYSFNGVIHHQNSVISIGPTSLLLRGCILRNTSWLVAVVIYTGADTKIMLNSGPTPSKRSKVDKQINPLVVLNVVTLCFLSLICATGAAIYNSSYRFETAMFSGLSSKDFQTGAGVAFISFFNCFIVFQNIIPIALYISLEVTKLAQSYLISQDLDMYDEETDQSIAPKSWNLCDDLGQIEYVFSDKTGTLTSNIMDFKKASIGGIMYGKWLDPTIARIKNSSEKKELEKEKDTMISRFGELFDPKFIDEKPGFIDAQLPLDLGADSEQSKRIKGFFSVLAICHTVLVEKPEALNLNNIFYRAQSPDEAALVTAAKNVGFACLHRSENNVDIDFMGTIRTYTILNILEFTSDRKRMSVIVLRPEGDILLMCKGADSVIYDRLDKRASESLLDVTSEHLSAFANEGLRTLCLAYRRIPKEEYDEWSAKYRDALAQIHGRDEKCNEVAELIENKLILMGATAIEDKLQDGVPEAIALLAKAGIKLWVLTGDKVETAINIGFSCNLLLKSMILIVIQAESPYDTLKQIREALQIFWDKKGRPVENKEYSLIIDGVSLKYALEYPCKPLLLELGCRCKAVLCCRVSPLQKALVVKLVREGLGAMCLAIGDGANDVSMIQEADIGIGISGKEGLQAVMASDYAISQFRFLAKLLLVHGRWAYVRSSELALNYFYKNITWLMILFWHQFFCGFTAHLALDYTYSILFNTIFTFFPTMTVGVFDQDINAEVSLELPQIYLRGIRQKDFRIERFWIYMAHGVYQSLICYFGIFIIAGETATGPNGFTTDASTMSLILATTSLIIINVFGTSNWYTWSWINFFSLTASMLTWVIFLLSFCASSASGPYGYTPTLSLVLIIIVVATLSLLPRLVIKFAQRAIFPNDTDILQEYQQYGTTNVNSSLVSFGGFPTHFKDLLSKPPVEAAPRKPTLSKTSSCVQNADGFEAAAVEAMDPKTEELKNSVIAETEKYRASSIGQVINDKVQKAGFFLKALLPERNPSYPMKKKGSIAYMAGNREMVENTGFAFSHDAGMQDVITPIQMTLPAVPEEHAGAHSANFKRRRFPSLVPDRFRQFSKKALQKLGKSRQSTDYLSDKFETDLERPPSPSTTPPLPVPIHHRETHHHHSHSRKPHFQTGKRASFSSFSRQMFSKNALGAKSHDNIRKLDPSDVPTKASPPNAIPILLDGKSVEISPVGSKKDMNIDNTGLQREMSSEDPTQASNHRSLTGSRLLGRSQLHHSHPAIFIQPPDDNMSARASDASVSNAANSNDAFEERNSIASSPGVQDQSQSPESPISPQSHHEFPAQNDESDNN